MVVRGASKRYEITFWSEYMNLERAENVFAQIYLYLRTPGGKLYFLKGKAVGVLYG